MNGIHHSSRAWHIAGAQQMLVGLVMVVFFAESVSRQQACSLHIFSILILLPQIGCAKVCVL